MKPMTDEQRSAIAQKLREIADILEPAGTVTAKGGGNGNGPPTGP